MKTNALSTATAAAMLALCFFCQLMSCKHAAPIADNRHKENFAHGIFFVRYFPSEVQQTLSIPDAQQSLVSDTCQLHSTYNLINDNSSSDFYMSLLEAVLTHGCLETWELFGEQLMISEGSGELLTNEDSCSELQFLDILCGQVMSGEIQATAARILKYYKTEVTEGYGNCEWLDENMLSGLEHPFTRCSN